MNRLWQNTGLVYNTCNLEWMDSFRLEIIPSCLHGQVFLFLNCLFRMEYSKWNWRLHYHFYSDDWNECIHSEYILCIQTHSLIHSLGDQPTVNCLLPFTITSQFAKFLLFLLFFLLVFVALLFFAILVVVLLFLLASFRFLVWIGRIGWGRVGWGTGTGWRRAGWFGGLI